MGNKDAAGIVSFGAYVPGFRIRAGEISKVWTGREIREFMGVRAKSVSALGEDSTTMGFEASRIAVKDPLEIDAVFFGSESKAYSVKNTAGIISNFLGIPERKFSGDIEFACKAGTTAMQVSLALVRSGMARNALAIGSDCAQGRPGDALEYTAGCGAVAFVLGKKNLVAEIEHTVSFSTDTSDFWRASGERFPEHSGRFTGEPGYFRHILGAAKLLFLETNTTPTDYSHLCLHQPNAVFPKRMALLLGIPEEKLSAGLFSREIGNVYSAGTMLSIAKALSVAKRGERILAISYGSGAGSDAFSIKVLENGKGALDFGKGTEISYGEYLRNRGLI